MDDDTNNHHRRSIRLRGYDYTQNGVYFVTICTHGRAHRFGQVNDGAVELSPAGQLLDRCWQALPRHFSFVTTDAYVIMPDHIHGILAIDRPVVAWAGQQRSHGRVSFQGRLARSCGR